MAALAPFSVAAQSSNPEDEAIPDVIPAVPTPTQLKAKSTTKESPETRPTKGAHLTIKPTATARPVAKSPALASSTPRVPTTAAKDLPTEEAPIEDQTIPDTSAAAATTRDGSPSGVAATATAASMAASSRARKNGPPTADSHSDSYSDPQDAEPIIVDSAPPEVEVEAPHIDTGASIWSPMISFEQEFMRHALMAGIIMALMCSYLGVYVVLKRIVFVGVALAEVSSTGIALAILLGFAPLLGAIGFMVLGVTLLSVHWSPRRVPHENYIGIIYSIAAALGVLFLAKSPTGETQMLKLLQGDVLTVSVPETWHMTLAFLVVGVLHALFSKEFLMVSFDRDAASTLGFRAAAWDYLLFLTIGITIAFSIRTAGVLVASTMLILPAVTALLVTSHLWRAWLLAPLLGVIPVAAGLHLSFVWDLPSSAVIVLLSFLLLLPALVWHFVKQRG